MAAAVIISKITLTFPVILHAFIAALDQSNIKVVGAFMKILKSSVPFEFRMDIGVIPEQIEFTT